MVMANFDGARGRLFLWAHALGQCQRLLEMAERANEELESGRAIEKTMRDEPKRRAYIESRPDYEPAGPQKLSHFVAADNAYPADFGHYGDCSRICDACRMLAIVFFCQPFNVGNSGEGVAKNDLHFREKYLPEVLEAAFPSQSDRDSFVQLLDQLKVVRDKVIAHGDAHFFQYADNGSISGIKMHEQSLKGIDFKQFATLLEPFIRQVYASALQAPLPDGGVGEI